MRRRDNSKGRMNIEMIENEFEIELCDGGDWERGRRGGMEVNEFILFPHSPL